MSKLRGFEVVQFEKRMVTSKVITEEAPVKKSDGEWIGDIELPKRSDDRSAGYDFFMPNDLILLPAQKTIVFTDVKAYMQDDEVLMMYPRSSMGIKQGLMLSNTTGVIDASYYENEGNDGNIGLPLLNTSGRAIKLRKGDRVVQGVFIKYLVTDEDAPISDERIGGMGSSGQ